jgi:hypothetical protein
MQLPAGSYHLAAAYGGDSGYRSSAATADIAITKAATSLTATPSATSAEYGTPLNIAAQLATSSYGASPTGSITLLDNGSSASASVQSATQLATAGYLPQYAALTYAGQYTPSSPGAHTLTASYSGDANYATASSPTVSLSISQATTSINTSNAVPTTAAPGAPVTLTANVSSASTLAQPTGTVAFYDNGVLLGGSIVYSGNAGPKAALVAALTTSFTQAGQHSISAAYTGDARYQAATQTLGTLSVQRPLALSLPVAQSQSGGGTSSAVLNIANGTAAALTITLSCAPASTQTSCYVTPATLGVAASSSGAVSVVYTVPALSGANFLGLGSVWLALLLLSLLIGRCYKLRLPHLPILLLLAATLLIGSACGGGTGQQSATATSSASKSQSYAFTITGSAGAYTDTQTLTVTVQ